MDFQLRSSVDPKPVKLGESYIQSKSKAIGQELIYEVKLQTSAWPGRPLTSNHPLGFCPPTKARLGVSKKVLKVLVSQRASKLQYLKVFGGIFLYIKVEQKF